MQVHTQDNHDAEETFLMFHRGLDKFSKQSVRESEAARAKAIQALQSNEHPAGDGAFVLRDSMSRPGSYGVCHCNENMLLSILTETFYVCLWKWVGERRG